MPPVGAQLALDDYMPLYDIPAPYRKVTTLPELERLMARLGRAERVAVDTETRPRRRDLPADGRARRYHSLTASLNQAIGLSFSFRLDDSPPEGEHYYLPLRHVASTKQLGIEQLRPALDLFLRNERIAKVFHHAKFDLNVLRGDGFEVRPLPEDTLMLASLLNLYELPRVDAPVPASVRAEQYRRERPPLGLKELARRHLDPNADRYEHAIRDFREGFAHRYKVRRADVTYDTVPVDLMVPYAASDTRWTLDLLPLLESHADANAARLYQTERALIPILADMEYQGARVDRAFLERTGSGYEAELATGREAVFAAAGRRDFDILSTPQLAEVFAQARIPIEARTASGKPSLTKAALQGLAKRHPLARAVLDYRKAAKLKGTYVDSLLAKLDANDHVHCSFKAHGTRTGRLSSDGPNLQNIPAAMRAAFIPPAGWLIVMIDYSQIELRLAAHYSRDPVMVDAFHRGDDIHTRTAIEVFGATDDAEEAKRRRKIAKNLNFAICYGAGPSKIAAMSGEPEEACRQHLDRFYRVFGRLAQWKREVVLRARAHGFVQNLYGRKRWLPILKDPSQRKTKECMKAERVAVNTLIQGSAADMFKETIVQVAALLGDRRARTRIVLNVHDELVLYVPPDEHALVSEIQRTMERPSIAPTLLVPLVADVSHSPSSWKDKRPGMPT